MKRTSVNTGRILKLSALVLSLGALALAGGTGCAGDRYNETTTSRSDEGEASRVREKLSANNQNPVASETNHFRDMSLHRWPSPMGPKGSPISALGY